MRTALIAILSAGAVGGLIGVFAAGVVGGAAGQADTPWTEPAAPATPAPIDTVVDALIETGHFGDPPNAAADADAGDSAIEAAPRIAATALIDGEIAVSVYGPSGELITVGVGDSLPGGWVVKNATLDRITIGRDNEDLEIDVFPRDDAGT